MASARWLKLMRVDRGPVQAGAEGGVPPGLGGAAAGHGPAAGTSETEGRLGKRPEVVHLRWVGVVVWWFGGGLVVAWWWLGGLVVWWLKWVHFPGLQLEVGH